jgi:divalent metal cation (Fe/Co/Zn/Cd) transporter
LASVLIGVHVLAIAALTLLTTLQWLMIITGLMVALSLYHATYNYVLSEASVLSDRSFRSQRATLLFAMAKGGSSLVFSARQLRSSLGNCA